MFRNHARKYFDVTISVDVLNIFGKIFEYLVKVTLCFYSAKFPKRIINQYNFLFGSLSAHFSCTLAVM